MLNTKLDKIRRDIYRDETEYNNRKLLKGTKWLLLNNRRKLGETAQQNLNQVLEINKPLAALYYLKEDLKQLCQQENAENASVFLESWVSKAYETGLLKLREFANTLLAHRTGIINWYRYKISTEN